jgi:hypothetical protein
MAFEAYARNLYAPVKLGPDLSFVIVTVAADGTRDADNSSPDTTVSAAGSGVYNITFPKAERGFVVGQPALVTTASDGVFVEVKAFAPTSGTIQLELSDEANLSSSETITLTLLLGGA